MAPPCTRRVAAGPAGGLAVLGGRAVHRIAPWGYGRCSAPPGVGWSTRAAGTVPKPRNRILESAAEGPFPKRLLQLTHTRDISGTGVLGDISGTPPIRLSDVSGTGYVVGLSGPR
jgi:hypothetical protein